jgi:hypothetical protein
LVLGHITIGDFNHAIGWCPLFFLSSPSVSILQYCIYPAITFATKKMLFNLIKKTNKNGNPIDTSIVVPVRGMA